MQKTWAAVQQNGGSHLGLKSMYTRPRRKHGPPSKGGNRLWFKSMYLTVPVHQVEVLAKKLGLPLPSQKLGMRAAIPFAPVVCVCAVCVSSGLCSHLQ